MKKKLNSKLFAMVAFAVSTVMLMSGCSSSKESTSADMYSYTGYESECATAEEYPMVASNTMSVADEYAEMEEGTTVAGNRGTESVENVSTNRKLIRTVSMEVETETFDPLLVNVTAKIAELGGYIESEYSYNGSAYSYQPDARYSSITARVPDDKLDEFVEEVSGISNVISKTTSTEDVTLQYVDTESRKEMYLAQQESLLALLETAQSMEDIAYLTEQLSEIRYNIESMESQLRTYDNLVDYATIYLNIQEVEILTPTVIEDKTVGQELAEGFMASLKDVWNSLLRFGMNIIIDLPYILRFLVIVAIIVFAIRLIIVIIKKCVKKKKAKQQMKLQQNSQTVEGKTENTTKKEEQTRE